MPEFADVYDSARGLSGNISDDRVINWNKMQLPGGRHLIKYIIAACPRISVEGDQEVDHTGLMSFLKIQHKDYEVTINRLASLANEAVVLKMLKKEFYSFLIQERCELST